MCPVTGGGYSHSWPEESFELNMKGQVGWTSKQSGLVEGGPANIRALEIGDL